MKKVFAVAAIAVMVLVSSWLLWGPQLIKVKAVVSEFSRGVYTSPFAFPEEGGEVNLVWRERYLRPGYRGAPTPRAVGVETPIELQQEMQLRTDPVVGIPFWGGDTITDNVELHLLRWGILGKEQLVGIRATLSSKEVHEISLVEPTFSVSKFLPGSMPPVAVEAFVVRALYAINPPATPSAAVAVTTPVLAPTGAPTPTPASTPTSELTPTAVPPTPTPKPRVEYRGTADVQWVGGDDGYWGDVTVSAWKLVDGVKVAEERTTFSVGPLAPCTTASRLVEFPRLSEDFPINIGWRGESPCFSVPTPRPTQTGPSPPGR